MTIKPCDKAKRHKWVWSKNYIRSSFNGSSAQLSSRGLYKCELCGATKVGRPAIQRADTGRGGE